MPWGYVSMHCVVGVGGEDGRWGVGGGDEA